jgi:hydrogenase nickel incorporation protein HypA/HybF
MHELGLCEDIVHAIERRAGDRAVRRVKVRVGCLHHVHPEAFEQSFEMASMGTVVEGAHAELVVEPLSVSCAACGRTFESNEPLAACPGCGSFDIEQDGGDQLVLESLVYQS